MNCIFTCLTLLITLTYSNIIAQNNGINNKEVSPDIVLENTLLWKVERSDIETSFLFGTIHLLPSKDFVISDKVLTAFELSDQIVLELDMDDPSMQMEVIKHVTRKDTSTLEGALSDHDYQKLDQLLKQAFGAGVDLFNEWQPAMVGTFLLKNFIEGEPASYEVTFIEMAGRKNKEILGLETPAEQLAIFHDIPYEDQIQDLREMLNEEDKVKKIYADLIAFYKKENIDGLYKFFMDYYDNPEQVEILLNKRNRSWVPKFRSFSKDKVSFFAVGAGHLSGENGIINLLRKEGYTVSPVLNNN